MLSTVITACIWTLLNQVCCMDGIIDRMQLKDKNIHKILPLDRGSKWS